jgi:hypothetical protein
LKRRVIRPNNRSYTGRHEGQRRDDPNTVRYESGLERDFLTLVRFRQDYREVIEQPETVKFTDSTGKRRSYTPDFQVTYASKIVIYEVKYRDELRQNWDEKYREIARFMRARAHIDGRYFRFVTEAMIRGALCENLRLLSPHQKWPPDEEMKSQILEALAAGPVSLLTLARLLCPTIEDRGLFNATIWRMIIQRHINTDLESPIGMGSLLWI